jgi:hypothetical protein
MSFMQVESDMQRVGNVVFNKGGNREDEKAWLRLKEKQKCAMPYVQKSRAQTESLCILSTVWP